MKNLFFTLLFLACHTMTQAQTTFKLRNEAETPYKVTGKLIAKISSTDGSSQFFMQYLEKEKAFQITEVGFEKDGTLSSIKLTTLPTQAMNFQTDGYGSRVEMEENEYYGKGQFAKLTLLCQGQASCFTEETVDIYAETAESTKKNVSYSIFYFEKKDIAEVILKEITTKK